MSGESLGDGGKIPRGRKIVRASPSLGFGLVADEITNKREGCWSESRGVESEYLENSSTGGGTSRSFRAVIPAFPFSETFSSNPRTESMPSVKK